MTYFTRRYGLLLFLLLVAGPAAAQERPAPGRECPPDARLQSGEQSPQLPQFGSGNLSDKLSRSEGVLCPPQQVDPDIHTPPPAGGRTPVIPPAGSPGGDLGQRPK